MVDTLHARFPDRILHGIVLRFFTTQQLLTFSVGGIECDRIAGALYHLVTLPTQNHKVIQGIIKWRVMAG
jgi:hypothetical protein